MGAAMLPAPSWAPLHVAVKWPTPLAVPPLMESEACTATPVTESEVEQLAAGTAPRVYVAPLVTPFSTTNGAVVSTTVMLKLPSAVLLRLLVAEQFTVVPPRANVEPDGGAQFTTTLVSRASVAVAL